jgi:hypothetical protein
VSTKPLARQLLILGFDQVRPVVGDLLLRGQGVFLPIKDQLTVRLEGSKARSIDTGTSVA